MSLLSVEKCIAALLDKTRLAKTNPRLNTLKTPILEANGKVLAENIVATIDVPPADNSAMDGYAVRSQDIPNTVSTENTCSLAISQRIHAGHAPQPLTKGTAARIFTGAEIPASADSVVIQENCTEANNSVEFHQPATPAANIRPQGQDIAKGSTILDKGRRLSSADIGLLASIGIANVNVYHTLTVAIVNTGDELVEPGVPLEKGQIYNSNRFMLDGMLRDWGFKTLHHNVTQDSLPATIEALKNVSENSDIVLTTGGVSVGETDFVKPAVQALGDLDVWKVAIKPGKPFAFGHIQDTPFIGLPGNPASVFVTLSVLAKPFLFAQQGVKQEDLKPTFISAKANFNRQRVRREEYLRARYHNGTVDLHPNQSSGVLSSTAWGNCLVRQLIDEEIKQGDLISILFY